MRCAHRELVLPLKVRLALAKNHLRGSFTTPLPATDKRITYNQALGKAWECVVMNSSKWIGPGRCATTLILSRSWLQTDGSCGVFAED